MCFFHKLVIRKNICYCLLFDLSLLKVLPLVILPFNIHLGLYGKYLKIGFKQKVLVKKFWLMAHFDLWSMQKLWVIAILHVHFLKLSYSSGQLCDGILGNSFKILQHKYLQSYNIFAFHTHWEASIKTLLGCYKMFVKYTLVTITITQFLLYPRCRLVY